MPEIKFGSYQEASDYADKQGWQLSWWHDTDETRICNVREENIEEPIATVRFTTKQQECDESEDKIWISLIEEAARKSTKVLV